MSEGAKEVIFAVASGSKSMYDCRVLMPIGLNIGGCSSGKG